MATAADALEVGWKHHQAGDYRRAKELYRQALQAERANAEAWCLLGETHTALGETTEAYAAYQQALRLDPALPERYNRKGAAHAEQGQHEEALKCYQQALRLQPDFAAALYNLGNALLEKGQFREAAAAFRRARQSKPDHAETCTNLGIALARARQLDEAVAAFRDAIQLKPDFAKAHHNLGVALGEQGKAEEAIACFREAICLKPDYPEAHYNLGNALADQGKTEEAVACFRQAIACRPEYAEAHNNLGWALTEVGKTGEAVVVLQQALRLKRNFGETYNNLGLAFAMQGNYPEAFANYQEALRLQPDYADVHNNLGSLFAEQQRLEEALASYQQALWLAPENASTRWNRSLALLTSGDFERGWTEYEWRWRRKRASVRRFEKPAWDGSPLAGRTLLIYMEQGLGDNFHFIRYAQLVKAQGGTVLVEAPPFLMPLLQSCPGIDRLIAEGGPLPDFDVQIPLLSLPSRLLTTATAIPDNVPYLAAKPELIERWRGELGEGPGLKFGIVWQGNPHHRWDRHRSIPLAQFAPLAAVEGVRLFSLQKGPGTEQLAAFTKKFPVTEFGGRLDTEEGAFMDTAAIMKNLDLIVACDTAAVHLAGALGVPVWVALSTVVDWRWQRGREDSPWYPSVRLFRQVRLGDWEGVFLRIAAAAAALRGHALRGATVKVELAPGEALDRLSILAIKAERIADPVKLRDVQAEWQTLTPARVRDLPTSAPLAGLERELKRVNEALWDVEDALRGCEAAADFGPRFIELARSVYRLNDRRGELKRQINILLGAPFSDQKSYGSREAPPRPEE